MYADERQVPTEITRQVTVLDSGCWRWTGGMNRARTRGHFRQTTAARWVWQQFHGTVPAGQMLDHFRWPDRGCIGSLCVHPDHVRPASARENVLRGETVSSTSAAADRCPHGHDYTPENTEQRYDGKRACRTCRSEQRGHWRGRPGDRTHCPHGHAYTAENTGLRLNPDGSVKQRVCRTCKREKARKRREASRRRG